MSGSNDSSSIDEHSYITSFHHEHDVESHASLIPAPRSTTISITSSLENIQAKSASSTNVCTILPEVCCQQQSVKLNRDDNISTVSMHSTSTQGNKETISLDIAPRNNCSIVM